MSVFLTPKCPQNKENDPNKLLFLDIFADVGLFHDIGKEIEQQRIQ